MNVARLAVSAGSLTLAVTGGFVLAGAPTAHAEECKDLLSCTTKNVGDTVRKVGEGDVKGTVEQTGKTVGDTVDGVRKTVSGSGGASDAGGSGGGSTPPSSGGGEDADPPSGGHDEPGKGGDSADGKGEGKGKADGRSKKKSKGHSAHESQAAGDLAGWAGDASRWVSLQQWQGPRLPVGALGALGALDGLRSQDTTTTTAAEREVPPPEVAAPPVTQERASRSRTTSDEPRYLTAIPAAEASTPDRPQPLPAGTVFAATTLAGTVGIAVLSVHQRRRRTR